MRTLQKEIVSRICWSDDRVIEDSERAYTGKNEIFENASTGCGGRCNENMRGFESSLTGGSPEPKLTIIPAGFAVWCAVIPTRKGDRRICGWNLLGGNCGGRLLYVLGL